MAPDSQTTVRVHPSAPGGRPRSSDHAAAHDADDLLRSRVIVILVLVTLASVAAMTVLIA